MIKLHWQQIPSPEITTIFCKSNFDGVVLDNEHGMFGERDLFSLIQLINAYGKRSYVRVANLDRALVRKIMDAGVYGIIFSTVENIDYVRNIHFCCSYPPNGSRGQGLCAENGWGEFPNLLQNRKPEIIAQIETKEGMDVLPIFMRLEEDGVHRIDRFLIGPYDLSASLGHVGDWDHPDFIDQMDKFNAIVPDEKKAIHLVSDIDRQRSKYKNYGLLAMGMDTLAVTRDVRRLNSFS